MKKILLKIVIRKNVMHCYYFKLIFFFIIVTVILILLLAKNYIEDLSLLISSKLHFLSDCENNEKLSSVQVMTIKIDVSFILPYLNQFVLL